MAQPVSSPGDETHSLTVKLNPAKDVPLRNLRQDAQGWYLFVNENWIPSSDEVEDRKLRHHLMERWAVADQAYRDVNSCFLNSLTTHYLTVYLTGISSTGKVPGRSTLNHAANYRHLVKILICCYLPEGLSGNHVLQGVIGSVPQPRIPTMITTTTYRPDAIAVDNTIPSEFLNEADFRAISMTHDGFAFFSPCTGIWFIIDQTDLDTGRMTLVSFNPDGTARDHIKLCPWNMAPLVNRYSGLAWPLRRLICEQVGGGRNLNQPIDMDIPLLDLLETTCRDGKFPMHPDCNREQWTEVIERVAPGYLELETQGRGNLRVIDASVIPVISDCHIQNSVYLIAEKGAEAIKEDHGDLYV
ncbi:uncharacterized protein N7483_007584 [Penicillium malachiteum]|uniref:uncharacterized protein n=1 Tax=Penicillium malachiteum TaxID=1324776 RepID=UPI002546C268|nr:uncharacterized protein N7483_007584 [Penicillium malachiteum]KAJ5726227.1 hypothetical protein N7483_007584 [Penicillium malachiteum]